MGSVYKLTDGVLIYYGSTKEPLHRKLARHKCPSQKATSKLLNRDKLTIELVEQVEDIEQLKWRERYYIENNQCVNNDKPIRTSYEIRNPNKEYYEKNKTKIKQYHIHYNKINKEYIKQQKSKPYQCECGSIVSTTHKAKHFRSKKHINFII